MENLKSLGINSKNVNQSKICLKENGVMQFGLKKNGNIKTFYSELAGYLEKMLPKPSLKFNTDKTMTFYKNQIQIYRNSNLSVLQKKQLKSYCVA